MCLSDLPTQGSYLFVEPDYSTAEAQRLSDIFTSEAYGKVILSLRKSLAEIEHTWSEANVSDVVHADMKQSGLKAKQYMTMLRHAITGAEVSPCHCRDGKLNSVYSVGGPGRGGDYAHPGLRTDGRTTEERRAAGEVDCLIY